MSSSPSSGNSIAQVAQFFDHERVNEMFKLAQNFHAAQCWGPDIKNPAQALVKIQAGFEMGMAPIEAMNSLYIVNGKITIYGMAMTKRLREHGWTIQYEEKPNEATATITKGSEKYSYTATMDELKKIKSKAAEFAGKDKLKWHALSRLIRFNVPEVLGAGVAYLQEEIADFDGPTVSVVEQPKNDGGQSSSEYDRFCEEIEKVKTRQEYMILREWVKEAQFSPQESEAVKEAMREAWDRTYVEPKKMTIQEAEELLTEPEQRNPASMNSLREAAQPSLDELPTA